MASIFDFDTSRDYLKAYLKQLPRHGHGESTKIAGHLGVSSTFVSQVLAGDRYLTPEHAHALAEYLGLSSLEADYLFDLVQLDRAGNPSLKKYLKAKLSSLKAQSLKLVNRVDAKKIFSDEEKSIFYSSPLYSGVHLYSSTGTKGRTLDEIMQRFELTRAKASEVVRFLKEANLLVEKDGRFEMGVQSTHVPHGSPHLLKHHANWRIKAVQTSEVLTERELMYTSQVSISEKDFAALREEMTKFIKSFLDKVHASPAEEIACLNMDWFWIRK